MTPDPVTMFSEPASSLYWPPDVARHDMEALLFSSSGWLRTACIVCALFWYGGEETNIYLRVLIVHAGSPSAPTKS